MVNHLPKPPPAPVMTALTESSFIGPNARSGSQQADFDDSGLLPHSSQCKAYWPLQPATWRWVAVTGAACGYAYCSQYSVACQARFSILYLLLTTGDFLLVLHLYWLAQFSERAKNVLHRLWETLLTPSALFCVPSMICSMAEGKG